MTRLMTNPPAIEKNKYTLVTDIKTLQTWIDDAYKTGHLAIDTETTHLTPAIAKLVGISICSAIGNAAYIPLGHVPEEVDLLGESKGDLTQIDFDKAIAALKPLLEDPSVLKIGQNIKYDWQMLKKHGINMSPCDDTMLISYTVDGTSHSNSMDGLSKLYLDHEPIKYEEVAGKGKNQVTLIRLIWTRRLIMPPKMLISPTACTTCLNPVSRGKKWQSSMKILNVPLFR